MQSVQQKAQFDMKTNVCIREFTRNGELLNERRESNRVTKIALLDLINFTSGIINPSMPNFKTYMSEGFPFYPRYLALGTNSASSGTAGDGVKTIVDVNDSHLLSEISEGNLRIPVQENKTISNIYSDPYIKLTLKCLIQSNNFDNQVLSEAGLFKEKSGNNCWARITFDPIEKEENSVLDVTWELVFVSVPSEDQPYEDRGSEEQKRLRALIKQYNEELHKEDYTEASWTDYENVLNYATAILQFSESNTYNLNKAYSDLENAKNNLIRK